MSASSDLPATPIPLCVLHAGGAVLRRADDSVGRGRACALFEAGWVGRGTWAPAGGRLLWGAYGAGVPAKHCSEWSRRSSSGDWGRTVYRPQQSANGGDPACHPVETPRARELQPGAPGRRSAQRHGRGCEAPCPPHRRGSLFLCRLVLSRLVTVEPQQTWGSESAVSKQTNGRGRSVCSGGGVGRERQTFQMVPPAFRGGSDWLLRSHVIAALPSQPRG